MLSASFLWTTSLFFLTIQLDSINLLSESHAAFSVADSGPSLSFLKLQGFSRAIKPHPNQGGNRQVDLQLQLRQFTCAEAPAPCLI
jgi:hypothetical protein